MDNIKIKDFLEWIDYRITDGEEFLWDCYGDSARSIESSSPQFSVTATFSTKNQRVYEVQAWDYQRDLTFRWIDPSVVGAVKEEYELRGFTFERCFDDRDFIDLDLIEDIEEKVKAIINDEEYDERVLIPLEVDDDTLFLLMQAAHERDVTLNEFITQVLEEQVKQEQTQKRWGE